jgi:hypothetical protein
VVLAFSLSSAQNHVTNLQGALATANESPCSARWPRPVIRSSTSRAPATNARQFVMLPDGTGYLVNVPHARADAATTPTNCGAS